MLKSAVVGEKSLKSLLRIDHRVAAPAEPVAAVSSADPGAPSRGLKPIPLLELASMAAPPSLSYRSVVTHAVLGHGPLELLTLPTELLHTSFSALDSVALCQLAQVSVSCRQLADDPLVWHAVRQLAHPLCPPTLPTRTRPPAPLPRPLPPSAAPRPTCAPPASLRHRWCRPCGDAQHAQRGECGSPAPLALRAGVRPLQGVRAGVEPLAPGAASRGRAAKGAREETARPRPRHNTSRWINI